MKELLALVLAGGRVDEMGVLTFQRAKAAVPFAGMYRICDYTMSNLLYSGVNTVGILSQYRPHSLIDHIRGGESWNYSTRGRICKFLTPFQAKDKFDWYKGTLDAVYQNLNFITKYNPKYTLILSGDHVYQMNYSDLLKYHIEKKAKLTIVVKPMLMRQKGVKYGIVKCDDNGLITDYEEKPDNPKSNLASLTIYLFDTKYLLSTIKSAYKFSEKFQIYTDIIPEAVKEKSAYAYNFNGYWNYTKTIDMYYEANFRSVMNNGLIYNNSIPLITNMLYQNTTATPPAHLCSSANVRESIVSPGCEIKGTVIRSILGPGVYVEKGASVVDSILFQDVSIGADSIIERTICDKKVKIGNKVVSGLMGYSTPNNKLKHSITKGINVIGKKCVVPDDFKIEKNVMIFPYNTQFNFNQLNSGETCNDKGEIE